VIIRIVQGLVPPGCRSLVTPGSRLVEDLNMDSIQLLSLAMQLETAAKFDLIQSSVDLTTIRTVDDVIRVVRAGKMSSNAAGARVLC